MLLDGATCAEEDVRSAGAVVPRRGALEPALEDGEFALQAPLEAGARVGLEEGLAVRRADEAAEWLGGARGGGRLLGEALPEAGARQEGVLDTRAGEALEVEVAEAVALDGDLVLGGHVRARHALVVGGERHGHAEGTIDREGV